MDSYSTEEKILRSARRVFIQKGYDGARMQEIADGAEINKAMLHYYFRNKDLLYERVFIDYMQKVVPNMNSIISDDKLDIFQKIEGMVHTYTDFLLKNPELPSFVIGEVSKRPDFLLKTYQKEENQVMIPFVPKLIKNIMDAMNEGKIRNINPVHLIVNMMAMCVFPFAAKPMMTTMLKMSEEDFTIFIQQRKAEICSFIHHSIAV